MVTRTLGSTDLEITTLGLGTWAIGGPWKFGWGPQDDNDSIASIHRALDHGINWIDTAPAYGLGHAEEIIARALRQTSRRPLVFTKCGIVWSPSGKPRNSLLSASAEREVEDSLRRLGVETLDLVQIHWPIPDHEIEEACEALERLRTAGKIRYLGVSNFDVSQMERARTVASIVSLQPPYSLMRPDVEAAELPYCQEHDLGVLAYSPMASGLLTGTFDEQRLAALPDDDFRKSSPRFREPFMTLANTLVERLRIIARDHGCTVPAAAVAWTLHHPAVTGAIVGIRHPDQLTDVIGAADVELTANELAELRALMPETERSSPR